MLKITVGATEHFDEATSRVVRLGGTVLEFEHSLVSLSKWEQKHKKPFLGKDEKTADEILDYFEAMVVTPNVSSETLSLLTQADVEKISAYIQDSMTATWFAKEPERPNGQTITNELIYSWMASAQIPIEFERWHLNRLFTLLKVISAQQQKPKKMSGAEALAQRRALNAQRMAAEGHTG